MPQERVYGEETAEAVDRSVRALVERAFAVATAILQRNRALLDRTAAALLAAETLGEPEIAQLKREIQPVPELLPAPLSVAAGE
jgi:cell division protease FtsH